MKQEVIEGPALHRDVFAEDSPESQQCVLEALPLEARHGMEAADYKHLVEQQDRNLDFQEANWASLSVVLLVVAADVFTVVILLLGILHWLK
jgi:hypothetical protein